MILFVDLIAAARTKTLALPPRCAFEIPEPAPSTQSRSTTLMSRSTAYVTDRPLYTATFEEQPVTCGSGFLSGGS